MFPNRCLKVPVSKNLCYYFGSLQFALIFPSCSCFIWYFLLLAVVLFRSREHENCSPQPGCVRAHIESKIQFFMDPISSFKVQECGLIYIFQGVSMSSIFYKNIGLCTCPLWCFANNFFKGIASFYLGGSGSFASLLFVLIVLLLNNHLIFIDEKYVILKLYRSKNWFLQAEDSIFPP